MNLSYAMIQYVSFMAEWILYLLFFLSILSVGFIIERMIYFRKKNYMRILQEKFTEAVNKKDEAPFEAFVSSTQRVEGQILLKVLRSSEKGGRYIEQLVNREITFHKNLFEKHLNFLGTVGSNAPFIGLLGTVLGIVRAFKDLSVNTSGGIAVVMAGISEALLATAVGLFVAIPAVIAFNYFQNKADEHMEAIQSLSTLAEKGES